MRKEPINSIEKSERFNYEVFETQNGVWKLFRSPEANYNFNRVTGRMESWGRTEEEDPKEFPAPNILDLEVTTICTGIRGKVCPYCYKANTPNGVNMSFDTFKKIIDIYPKSLTQIAFGADATLKSNPAIWDMMKYAREKGIVPNVTAVDIDDETADKLAKYCGAVAVSYHEDIDVCADSIKKLTDRGMSQVNMHLVIYDENFDECMSVLKAVKEDPRLKKLNAVVMLSLKQKGRAVKGYTALSQEKFNKLCNYARENKIGIGFDSCSSLKAFRAFDESVRSSIIPCEATRESSFISVGKTEEGPMYYPCSFAEGEEDWKKGLPVLECNSPEEFITKIWNHPKTLAFKDSLNKTACDNCENCRHCPMFNV